MRDDISILDDLQRGGYGRVHRRRASADAASATLPASLSLPLSHRLRDFRGLPREEDAVTEKTERKDPVEKEKEIERERESDSSPQGRSETMRASIDPLSFSSCRVELTCPGLPLLLFPSSPSFLSTLGIYLARGISLRDRARVSAIAQLKTGRAGRRCDSAECTKCNLRSTIEASDRNFATRAH